MMLMRMNNKLFFYDIFKMNISEYNDNQYECFSYIEETPNPNKITNVSGLNITLESPLQYPLTVSPYTVTVRSVMPIENINISGFTMLGGGVRATPLANGNGPCGIYGQGVDNISVEDCKFYGFT